MEYKILITTDAEEDLNQFIRYLLLKKKSKQAASNLLEDFETTIKDLSQIAGSLKYCSNPKLKEMGYKRKNFISHKYYLLYRIVDDIVYVDRIFHELQDLENRIY